MKKIYFLFLTILISGASFGQVLASDDFNYPNGSLVPNNGWTNHSGTEGDLLIASNRLIIEHGAPSEDAHLPFTAVSGKIYFAFDFIVVDPGAVIPDGDNEYFAHFHEVGAFNFRGRMDLVAAPGGGDFSVGISSTGSTADATWPNDLTYGTSYRATVMYDQDANMAQLWIDASTEADASILGADEDDPGTVINGFAVRQSDSDLNESIIMDNLIVSQSFNETLSTKESAIDGFSMYPNPTNTGFVNISSLNNDAMNVQVFDVLGKQVINGDVINNRLDVSQLKTGLYILKARQGGAISTKKLVIR